jgi:HK97 family phage prohead protease
MLRFAGYAAIFDRIDSGGDIVRRGAFGALAAGERLPLLWQHRSDARIGWISMAREDDRGLRVIGQIEGEHETARRASAMLRGGTVRGLSFGYRVQRSRGAAPRELLALDVAEISLVTRPMQSAAVVLHLAPF